MSVPSPLLVGAPPPSSFDRVTYAPAVATDTHWSKCVSCRRGFMSGLFKTLIHLFRTTSLKHYNYKIYSLGLRYNLHSLRNGCAPLEVNGCLGRCRSCCLITKGKKPENRRKKLYGFYIECFSYYLIQMNVVD